MTCIRAINVDRLVLVTRLYYVSTVYSTIFPPDYHRQPISTAVVKKDSVSLQHEILARTLDNNAWGSFSAIAKTHRSHLRHMIVTRRVYNAFSNCARNEVIRMRLRPSSRTHRPSFLSNFHRVNPFFTVESIDRRICRQLERKF